MSDHDELLALLKLRSFVHRPDRPFQLSSGKTSPFYLDGKRTTLDPRGAALVGRLCFERLRGRGIAAVGGLTLGADPVAVAVALTSDSKGEPIRAFIVRKEPKGHGTQNWIEGGLEPGSRVAVVEDVVTSGRSICLAIQRVKEAGHTVAAVLAIVDREEGGAKAVEEASGLQLESLFRLSDFLAQ
ncbi:MAG TPA: orotate phosphoribosyltransferase [Nitrospiria bacterium]|nr:orotate phosphoribosyltransferase [Nitrospiria bacterium]